MDQSTIKKIEEAFGEKVFDKCGAMGWLGCSQPTIDKLHRSGELKKRKYLGKVFYLLSDLKKYIASC